MYVPNEGYIYLFELLVHEWITFDVCSWLYTYFVQYLQNSIDVHFFCLISMLNVRTISLKQQKKSLLTLFIQQTAHHSVDYLTHAFVCRELKNQQS